MQWTVVALGWGMGALGPFIAGGAGVPDGDVGFGAD